MGPGNLTSWKDELLRDLFQRTRVYLRARARPADRRARQDWPGGASEQLRASCGLSAEDPRVAPVLGGLPDRYFAESALPEIARHMQRAAGAPGALRAARWSPSAGKSHVELVVVADDVPGLLAKITGVLFANKLDIMDAAIYSRRAVRAR